MKFRLNVLKIFGESEIIHVMQNESKECGQLANPTDGALVCADNNIHLEKSYFRLKTCKVLCRPGFSYRKDNETLFYCTSNDIGMTVEERDIMRIIENFTDLVLTGNFSLKENKRLKISNSSSHKEFKKNVTLPGNKTDILNDTKGISRESIQETKDYYYIPRSSYKEKPIVLNYLSKKVDKIKKIESQQNSQNKVKLVQSQMVEPEEKFFTQNSLEAVKYLLNIATEAPQNYLPIVNSFPQLYQTESPNYFYNSPTQYSSYPTFESPHLNPINVFKDEQKDKNFYGDYETWNDIDIIKNSQPNAQSDQSWKYFENKNNPLVDQVAYGATSLTNLNIDSGINEWKRDNYFSHSPNKIVRSIKNPTNSKHDYQKHSLAVQHNNTAKKVYKKKKIHKKKVSIRDLATSDKFKELSKSQRQKLSHILKKIGPQLSIVGIICREIPSICQNKKKGFKQ
ncbi:LOW QUALITY PROTEIN: hypothetical protein MXB_5525, partial [Myxobolus squamalis]